MLRIQRNLNTETWFQLNMMLLFVFLHQLVHNIISNRHSSNSSSNDNSNESNRNNFIIAISITSNKIISRQELLYWSTVMQVYQCYCCSYTFQEIINPFKVVEGVIPCHVHWNFSLLIAFTQRWLPKCLVNKESIICSTHFTCLLCLFFIFLLFLLISVS